MKEMRYIRRCQTHFRESAARQHHCADSAAERKGEQQIGEDTERIRPVADLSGRPANA